MAPHLTSLKILAVEPYFGGSHRSFLEGYRSNSRHALGVLSLPARKWKWRMRGGAMIIAERIMQLHQSIDALFVTDYLDLACLVGLAPRLLGDIPKMIYFHENQLTYPVPDESMRDYQFGFTNITSCMTADSVVFNSNYHRESFLEAVRTLLRRMPDFVPRRVADRIEERSRVIPVGLDLETIDAQRERVAPRQGPPVILWNHRWEYDKDPDTFFRIMAQLAREGYDFRIAVIGESFRMSPEIFTRAKEELSDRIVRYGFVESRTEYVRTLLSCDIVISTAIHEFFGMAVMEATYAGCFPLLPNALTYPELFPRELHPQVLYKDADDLTERLRFWLTHVDQLRALDVHEVASRYSWGHVAPQLDNAFLDLAGSQA